MPRVFVSHSTEDRAFVEQQVVGLLQQHGVDTWYSRDSIQGAERWERSILQGLRECDWFLVVMSPRSARSPWVKHEVDWAFAKRLGRIIPVLMEDCDSDDFHIGLAGIQHLDFRTTSREPRKKLLAVLAAAGARAAESSAAAAPPQPNRPTNPEEFRNSLGTRFRRLPAEVWQSPEAGRELYVACTCVTNREYAAFVRAGGPEPRKNPKKADRHTWTGKEFPEPMAEHPVVLVSQADARRFCEWLTEKEWNDGTIGPDDVYALPRFEQWKAFARPARVPADAVLDRQWLPRFWQPTEPVTWGVPTELGLFGLFGNVFEWCRDEARKKFRVPAGDGRTESKTLPCGLAVGGGWASSRQWLEQELAKGAMGGIWCPEGGPLQDGGFRVCLSKKRP